MFMFFFKQKTAYEMRISDWSSDVCSSDLCDEAVRGKRVAIRDGSTAEQAVVDNKARETLEHDRYRSVYGIDLGDRSAYDLVLDSSAEAPPELAEAILTSARATFPD